MLGKTTKIIHEIREPGGPFIAEVDNGMIRIGYQGGTAYEAQCHSFWDLARRATIGMSDDAFREGVKTAIRLCGWPANKVKRR